MARGAGARGSGFKLTALESFSGGLNFRSDQFNLAPNESPDLLNVVVDPRGGVRMRDGVDRRNTTALSADVQGMWGFHTDSGTNAVMVNYSTKVAHSTSTNFTLNVAPLEGRVRLFSQAEDQPSRGTTWSDHPRESLMTDSQKGPLQRDWRDP